MVQYEGTVPHWCSITAVSDDTARSTDIAELIQLTGSVDGISCEQTMLVDSGATCNFVSQALADRMPSQRWRLQQPLIVKTADGSKVRCSHMIADANITLPGYSGEHDLLIMPHLDVFEVVLGRAFLKASKAIVHHETSAVVYTDMATKNPWQLLDISSLDKPLLDDDDTTVTPSTDNASHSQQKINTSNHNQKRAVVKSTNCQQAARQPALTTAVKPTNCHQALTTVVKPTNTPSSPATLLPLTDEALASIQKLLARVDLYNSRMKPKDGRLPPSRGEYDHRIELKDPSAKPVKSRSIPLNAEERAQLAIDIKELEETGLIVRSESEWASPVFYVSKDGGKARRLVVDYRGLNRLLKRNSMTLPHIDELLARLGNAKFFTKLDLRSSYHQILVRPEDRHMTAFSTPIGHFEWRVLPFGEANAPSTFVQMMRHLVLADMTDRGVLDFVDDVLVYSETAEQHVRDVSDVLDRLEKHELFIRPEKCKWMVQQVDFLGFTVTATISGTTIEPMRSKVEAVTDWPKPRTQTQLRSFLGFSNTFRNFIDGFSGIAAPLFDLLKRLKNKRTAPLRWNDNAHEAFDALKAAISDSATLAVADDSKPFVVHTDASDYAVGAVLSQRNDRGELRPIGFVSEKLSDVEYRWSVYEKELYSIVVALKHWSMWLMHANHPVEIHNDHASLQYLLDQPRLTSKQTRWLALFSTFAELRFVHVKGSDNTRADALSRRADHNVGSSERRQIRSDIARKQFSEVFGQLGLTNARINTLITEVSAGNDEIATAIINGYADDTRCKQITDEPQRYGYQLRWGMLERISDGSVLVPNDPQLRARILRCVHDAPTSGHLGINKTFDRLLANYHWPNQWLDVADYVNSCNTCQQAKNRSGRTPGLLHPIEIQPKAHTIALDFLGPLSRTARGKDSILVIIDAFTKRVSLEAVTTTITAEQTAEIVINRIIRHQGVPRAIRSDRDSRFTGDVWNSIWSRLGSELKLTTAHHHESNGLPERFMQTLQASLRAFTNTKGTDWDLRLASVELAYNSSKHASTGISPIELDIGVTPRMPINLTQHERPSASLSVQAVLDRISMNEITAFRTMIESQHRDKQRVDSKRRDERYAVGDFVWLETSELQLMNMPGSKKLRSRWCGPFEVKQVQDDLNVLLDLPNEWKIHPVIHIARLKRAHQRDDQRFPSNEEPINTIHEQNVQSTDINLSDYNERGSIISQIEHDDALDIKPRTRAAVQAAHDRGERHDYVELRDAWDERRQMQQHQLAQRQRETEHD